MSKVFVHVGISLDGFLAGANRGPKNPMGGRAPDLHGWLFRQQAFLDLHLGFGDGEKGETGPDNAWLERTTKRIGANIMGKRMYDEGEASWPEESPFHTPVFVLTHEKREPKPHPGGTTFYFVNEPIDRVLVKAREAAGDKDVRISGGADVIVQYLNAGLVDDLVLDIAPVFLGEGLRLFDGIDRERVKLEITEIVPSKLVTHVRYSLRR